MPQIIDVARIPDKLCFLVRKSGSSGSSSPGANCGSGSNQEGVFGLAPTEAIWRVSDLYASFLPSR